MDALLKVYAEEMAKEYFIPEMRNLRIKEKFAWKETSEAYLFAAKRKTKHLTVYVIGLFPFSEMASMIIYSQDWKVLGLTASKETFNDTEQALEFLEKEWKKASEVFAELDNVFDLIVGIVNEAPCDEMSDVEYCEKMMDMYGISMDKN